MGWILYGDANICIYIVLVGGILPSSTLSHCGLEWVRVRDFLIKIRDTHPLPLSLMMKSGNILCFLSYTSSVKLLLIMFFFLNNDIRIRVVE